MSYTKPVNLVMKRGSQNDGNSVEASWGFTGGSTFDTSVEQDWYFNASKNMSERVIEQNGSGSATGDIVWNRPTGTGLQTSASCFYNREKYHPVTFGRYLESVKLIVANGSYGGRWYEDYVETAATMAFKKPAAPTIPEPGFDDDNGRVTFTIEAAGDDGQYERYDTMYRILRQDSANRDNEWKSEKTVLGWTATTSDSAEYVYGIRDEHVLSTDEWVRVTCQAYSRGLAGNSSTTSRTFVYAYPAQASITSIVASRLDGTGIVSIRLKTNTTTTSPVDSIKLQRLRSTSITTSTAAGLASGWQDVDGAISNGNCDGLCDQVADALPNVKTHTWYRIVSTHGYLTRNSVPVEATCLYRAKDEVADDEVKFVSVKPGADGKSILARIAWRDDDSDTTQISWSEYEDAWESTEQPSTCDVTWLDDGSWTDDSVEPAVTYQNVSTVTIRGLEEASPYYVRARRGRTQSDPQSFGSWCYPNKLLYPMSTSNAPEDVVLVVPSTVQRGDGVDCSWTFSGSEQTAWEIAYQDADRNRIVLVSGDGAAGFAVVPAKLIEGMDSVKLSVSVTCGGDWASSGWLPVSIEDAPDVSIEVPQTLTEQPLEITVHSDTPRANVLVYVTSRGVVTATPAEEEIQADGDVVWSTSTNPRWVTGDNETWSAVIEAPKTKLHEGATYDVTAVVTDTKTMLSSDWANGSFSVAWEHRAVPPSDATTIVSDLSDLSARITPAIPTEGYAEGDGYDSTDVVDVYRTTPDGSYLIARDVPFGYTVRDPYAPFSNRVELAYTLCTRTKDGDISWAEYPYELHHGALRFDFGEESVELPYNIVHDDSWEKSFELREHLDGKRVGYWNPGATRSESMSTDVIKIETAEKRRLVGDLAKHVGPCFVRLPDGCAYPAHVDVESYSASFDSASVPVSIKATEVTMSSQFAIAPHDWEEPGSGSE